MGIFTTSGWNPQKWAQQGKPKTSVTKSYGSTPYYAPVPGLGGNGTPSFSDAYSVYNQMAAPQYAAIDQMQAQNRSKIASLQAQFLQAQQFAGQNTGFVNRGYGLNMEGLGIQQAAQARDAAMFNKLQNLLNENYVREHDQVNTFRDLYHKGHEGQMGYTNTLEDLANQILGLQTWGREQDYFYDKKKTTGQLAASGGFGSTGTGTELGHLFQQKDTDVRGFQLSNKEKLAGINEQRRALKQAYEEAMLSFADQQADLTYAYNTQAESLWNQAEANNDEIAMLDLKAKEYGLQRDQMIATLTQGLKNLQLSNTININDLVSAIESGDPQRAILAQQVWDAASRQAPPPPANPTNQSGGGSYVKRGKAF